MQIAVDLKALGFVSNAVQHVPGNVEHVGVCFGGNLTGHHDVTTGGHNLTGDAAGGIYGQTRVQDVVCAEIAELVGVAFGDSFSRIKSAH